jgi:hypothetical protein
VQTAVLNCLWYGVFGTQPVQVVLVRDGATTTGYGIALVSTDLTATAAQIIERYAARWSIEVAIEDAKQISGVGQARNRLRTSVERTVPFGLAVSSLAICWYATAGYHPDDVTAATTSPPGTATRTSPPSWTCSPNSAASSSPRNFEEPAPNRQHRMKSRPSGWPGLPKPHKCESRDTLQPWP